MSTYVKRWGGKGKGGGAYNKGRQSSAPEAYLHAQQNEKWAPEHIVLITGAYPAVQLPVHPADVRPLVLPNFPPGQLVHDVAPPPRLYVPTLH
jgi:hypothetical protein